MSLGLDLCVSYHLAATGAKKFFLKEGVNGNYKFT